MSGNRNSGRRRGRPGNMCARGHLVEGDNYYVQPSTGYTVCRQCTRDINRDRARVMRAAQREARAK